MAGTEGLVTAESKSREELESELRFYTLLSEISARFVNVPASEVDLQIEKAEDRLADESRFPLFSLSFVL